MKQIITIVFVFMLMITIAFGCDRHNIPPDIASVQQRLNTNYNDVIIVIDYMIHSDYTDIYISDDSGTMLADLERTDIPSEDVFSAVQRLIGENQYRSISKHDNTIDLTQWGGIMKDIGCGIAYTINGQDLPDVQFVTELVPLEEENWYYYVTDYNAWRTGKRPQS